MLKHSMLVVFGEQENTHVVPGFPLGPGCNCFGHICVVVTTLWFLLCVVVAIDFWCGHVVVTVFSVFIGMIGMASALPRSVDLEWWVWLPRLSGHFVSFCCILHYIVMCGWRSQGVHFGCGSGRSLLLGHLCLQLRCQLASFVCSSGYTGTPLWGGCGYVGHLLLFLVCVLPQLVYFLFIFFFFLCSLLVVVAILLVGVAPTDKLLGPVQECCFYVDWF